MALPLTKDFAGVLQTRTIVRVLVIEKNITEANTLRDMLRRIKFVVDVVNDGETGLKFLLRGIYDVAIIDADLPKRDGLFVCRNARAQGVRTPLLMLSSTDAVDDRVRSLNDGADDCLMKPFTRDELATRLRSLLRRRNPSDRLGLVTVGDLDIDSAKRRAAIRGTEVPLSSREFSLLALLARNQGIAFSRTRILEGIWGATFDGPDKIVDVNVSHIRRKLIQLGSSASIVTIWGFGFKLVDTSKTS